MSEAKASTKTIALNWPVDVKSAAGGMTKLTEVTVRRLKAKDLELLPEGFGEGNMKPKMMVPMIAALSGHSVEVIGELDMEDLGRIANGIGDFLSGYLGTGASGAKSSGVSP